jgi:hypothetical protein
LRLTAQQFVVINRIFLHSITSEKKNDKSAISEEAGESFHASSIKHHKRLKTGHISDPQVEMLSTNT